jgi:hypothetical protein
MPTHSLTMTRPGDMTGYQSVCHCGWQGTTHQPAHVCTVDAFGYCTDLIDWRMSHEEAERAAVEEGREHMAGLS